MPPPPRPPHRLPPPLPGRTAQRRKPQHLAIAVGVLSVACVIAAIMGIVSLSNPNPVSESGTEPAPVASQPVGSTLPETFNSEVSPAPAPRPAPAPAQPAVTPQPAAPEAAPVSPPAGGTAQDVIARVKASVVLILAVQPGSLGSGTGFVIGPGRIATCHHVVAAGGRLLVFVEGRQAEARVVQSDPASDLAVLAVEGPLPPPLRLAESAQVRDGDEIAVTGYPVVAKLIELGYDPTPSTTRGTVSAKRRREIPGGTLEEVQIDAAINPGNSGGPVYSTRDGSVVGIASSKLVEESGMGFAISSGVLRRLLRN